MTHLPTKLYNQFYLDKFRNEELAPGWVLCLIDRFGRVLLRVPLGVGKSTCADRLIEDPETFRRYKRVVYAATSWDILQERRALKRGDEAWPVSWVALKSRPVELCGVENNKDWVHFEKSGSFDTGRDKICGSCPARADCYWPRSLAQKVAGRQLVFMAEAYLLAMPDLLFKLRHLQGDDPDDDRPTLLILDEAKIANSSFAQRLEPLALRQFADLLQGLIDGRRFRQGPAYAQRYIDSITRLLDAGHGSLTDVGLDFPKELNRESAVIQDEGFNAYGTYFRYLGYTLEQMDYSLTDERWKDQDGVVTFLSRPHLGYKLLVLSAHLKADYLEDRLSLSGLHSPFEHLRFLHTGTKVWNLLDSGGPEFWFKKLVHRRRLLDFFAVLVLRNLTLGRSTMLVARKKWKDRCAKYLEKRLAGWGYKVRFVTKDYGAGLPKVPEPGVIPIIHYKMTGVNTFEEYQAAYCLMSYYPNVSALSRLFFDGQPPGDGEYRVAKDKATRTRYPEIGGGGSELQGQKCSFFFEHEIDPVLQAGARVRYCTRPREVGFFQMHELDDAIGAEVTRYWNLDAAYAGLKLPKAAEIDAKMLGAKVRGLLDQGLSQRGAARELGLDKSKVTRLKQSGCLTNYDLKFIINSETEDQGGAAPWL